MKRACVLSTIAAASVTLGFAAPAEASLNVFQTFVGNYGLSSDGAGSLNADNSISAFVPVGATVVAAYLYQSNYGTLGNQPISLNGTPLTFGANVPNATACCNLNSSRADVTSLVSPLIDGGPGGTYNFTVTEGNTTNTDGTALVVVYQLASLPTSTIAILDGFSAVGGDTARLNFSSPLDPTASGFAAEMRLGIGFSCCGQSSTVSVNGTTITNNAGNDDDGTSGDVNGSLITVGGNNDPFSPFLPTYAQDHERYNLVPDIHTGDTSITIDTNNPTHDDNIFLALFDVTGIAQVTTGSVPEPSTWAMMILGFGATGIALRRKRKLSAALA